MGKPNRTLGPQPLTNVFDEDERDHERDEEGFRGTAHASAHDDSCPICTSKHKDAIESLYLRGDPPGEIAKLIGPPLTWQAIERHARGLNLDITLSKDVDRALALMIARGLHDLHPHSVDAKVLLGAIHERALLDGKITQRIHLDRPAVMIFSGNAPEPGVVKGRQVMDSAPTVPLDVPQANESVPLLPAAQPQSEEKGGNQ